MDIIKQIEQEEIQRQMQAALLNGDITEEEFARNQRLRDYAASLDRDDPNKLEAVRASAQADLGLSQHAAARARARGDEGAARDYEEHMGQPAAEIEEIATEIEKARLPDEQARQNANEQDAAQLLDAGQEQANTGIASQPVQGQDVSYQRLSQLTPSAPAAGAGRAGPALG